MKVSIRADIRIVTLRDKENKNKTITFLFKWSNGEKGVKHTNKINDGICNDDVEWINDLNVNTLLQVHNSNKHSC